MAWLKWGALGVVVLAVLLYAAARGAMYALQDGLLFHPADTSRATLDEEAARLGITPFTVTAADGVVLYGWHRRGHGDRALLYLHGNGGSITAVPWLAEQLPGVDVLCVSYRGYPGSDGVPSEAGMRLDALALWAHAIDDLGFRPDQIVVQGQSMGGGVAHHLLMEVEPAAVVFDSTFVSLQALAVDAVPWLQVRVPALVFHGDADTLIPVAHGRQLASLLPHATYVELAGHGHGNWTLDRPEALAPWHAFLDGAWAGTLR